MENQQKKIKIAVNGGIKFGSKLSAKQLVTMAKYLDDEQEIEVTTFQQLYMEVPEEKKDEVIREFESVGLHCYPVGNFVKSLRTCNFCKGAEEEGMPVAIELNKRIAGIPVPFTLKPAYTGCPVGCGEPLLNDIGIIKMKEHFNLYVGGKSKGKDAEVGFLLLDHLTPEELYIKVEKIIQLYSEQGKKREAFHKFIKRMGTDYILEQLK
ncbi:nitrite reductase [Pseudoneobacillus rhizosphaerae]|uniref:Cobalt-factor III methyltransferase n=1 Tax=Pseudoneobacillus rhizosphaerae TaxID=2880968 RepID=A0A9C7GEE5_9BACI|nr:nitrite reductase [Pseudoneobacillus rhizosphaerae]CAG9610705.1 Cobalt-factor III methyltransferase [Pseudoneobacillus rhizosphaerae]